MRESERETARLAGQGLMALALGIAALVAIIWMGSVAAGGHPIGGLVALIGFIFFAGLVICLYARFAP